MKKFLNAYLILRYPFFDWKCIVIVNHAYAMKKHTIIRSRVTVTNLKYCVSIFCFQIKFIGSFLNMIKNSKGNSKNKVIS
jgi:hypothetical protein